MIMSTKISVEVQIICTNVMSGIKKEAKLVFHLLPFKKNILFNFSIPNYLNM